MTISKAFLLPTLESTQALAQTLAEVTSCPNCITLRGDLGAGKTSFSQFFIRHLTSKNQDVTSPTFTLLQTYDTHKGPIWHYDLYRLENPEETIELAMDDAFDNTITLIEWPEIMESTLPRNRLDIVFSFTETPNERNVELKAHGHWQSVLNTLNIKLD